MCAAEVFLSLCAAVGRFVRSFKSPNSSSLERTHAAPLISDLANDLLGKHRVRNGKLKKVYSRESRSAAAAGIILLYAL